MENTAEKQAEVFVKNLIVKAWESDSFKDQLVKNPKVAIEAALGPNMMIPKGQKIIVEDQTNPNVIYLNIPPRSIVDSYELNEEQLEGVAGGIAPLVVLAWIGGAAAVAQIADWVGQGYNSVK